MICLFIVIQNSVMKYMTRIGQKTGMLKNSKKVQVKAMTVAFVAEYQNLNSGRRLLRVRKINADPIPILPPSCCLPDKGPELVRLPGGQGHPLVFLRLQLGQRGIDLGREERQQEVEVVDGQGVGDDVPALIKGETRRGEKRPP